MIRTFNLERFATHDGDGIRTVVFLKGCALRCPWCANPESQPHTLTLFYHKSKCTRCGMCEQLSNGAISFENDEFICDEKKISNLENIVDHCPTGAIELIGKDETIEEIVEEVLKDIDYYKASGGGVTISGGEPFTLFSSFLALIKRLKDENLNVAVETCGNFTDDERKLADPYIDTYLFDLKHMDPVKYEQVVKGKLEVVLHNIQQIDPNKIVLRVPVIPDFNNDEETLHSIIEYSAKRKIKELHFLPYHLLALDKYTKMRIPYEWNQKKVDIKSLNKYKSYAEEQGIELIIGG